mmetsp:Transcript_3946/g.8479  ORF Transcript_3946/g.8479 Transcript_3946/m.8479 type:complete len:303 (-) Transcript_3946:444-1352(-)
MLSFCGAGVQAEAALFRSSIINLASTLRSGIIQNYQEPLPVQSLKITFAVEYHQPSSDSRHELMRVLFLARVHISAINDERMRSPRHCKKRAKRAEGVDDERRDTSRSLNRTGCKNRSLYASLQLMIGRPDATALVGLGLSTVVEREHLKLAVHRLVRLLAAALVRNRRPAPNNAVAAAVAALIATAVAAAAPILAAALPAAVAAVSTIAAAAVGGYFCTHRFGALHFLSTTSTSLDANTFASTSFSNSVASCAFRRTFAFRMPLLAMGHIDGPARARTEGVRLTASRALCVRVVAGVFARV